MCFVTRDFMVNVWYSFILIYFIIEMTTIYYVFNHPIISDKFSPLLYKFILYHFYIFETVLNLCRVHNMHTTLWHSKSIE